MPVDPYHTSRVASVAFRSLPARKIHNSEECAGISHFAVMQTFERVAGHRRLVQPFQINTNRNSSGGTGIPLATSSCSSWVSPSSRASSRRVPRSCSSSEISPQSNLTSKRAWVSLSLGHSKSSSINSSFSGSGDNFTLSEVVRYVLPAPRLPQLAHEAF
jgi:hypothetical protein